MLFQYIIICILSLPCLAIKPQVQSPHPAQEDCLERDLVVDHILSYLSTEPRALCTSTLVCKKWTKINQEKNKFLKELQSLRIFVKEIAPIPPFVERPDHQIVFDQQHGQVIYLQVKEALTRLSNLVRTSEKLPKYFIDSIHFNAQLASILTSIWTETFYCLSMIDPVLDAYHYELTKLFMRFKHFTPQTFESFYKKICQLTYSDLMFVYVTMALFKNPCASAEFIKTKLTELNDLIINSEQIPESSKRIQLTFAYINATLALPYQKNPSDLAQHLLDFTHAGYLKCAIPILHPTARLWIAKECSPYLRLTNDIATLFIEILNDYEISECDHHLPYHLDTYTKALKNPTCPLSIVRRLAQVLDLRNGSLNLFPEEKYQATNDQLRTLRKLIWDNLSKLRDNEVEAEYAMAQENGLQPMYCDYLKHILKLKRSRMVALKRKYHFNMPPKKKLKETL